jgi:hypothetical protein
VIPYENFTQVEIEALIELIPRIRSLGDGDLVKGCRTVNSNIDWIEEMEREQALYLEQNKEYYEADPVHWLLKQKWK